VLFRRPRSLADTALTIAASCITPCPLHRYLPAHTFPIMLPQHLATTPLALPHQPDPAPLTFPSSHCPLLVPSKSNTHDSSVPRRGLAGEATEQLPGGARAQHGWASQRAVARRGGQGGPDAGCAVVTVSAFVSGIRCPVSGASVRCPTGACPVTGVRCGRLSVQVSQCPASGVCALRRPRCPTAMRLRGVAVGRQPYG
jgi:hypothetical protein